jgi:phage tail sheath protein FI
VASPPTSPPTTEEGYVEFGGGDDGADPDLSHFQDAFSGFVKIRDIRVICLPGKVVDVPADRQVIDAAISHCEAVKSRMLIVDPPMEQELLSGAQITALSLPTSTYTALYYPWAKVVNQFYDAEENPGVPTTALVPPSAFAAGMWGKIDQNRGVWKAPAGLETQLLGIQSLRYVVEDAEQNTLNPLGVNALRTVLSFGKVIWGARTLATKADPEWRYVPVRRTAIYIEQSIYGGIQWAVFEGNNHVLWAALRANIDAFMEGMYRNGAFQGEKKSDAYFVRCGLGDTMTQNDIDAGRVIVVVGFAPLKPAEFVIVRIQQKVNQQ